MRIVNSGRYILLGFRQSQTKGKKIDAILQDKKTKRQKIVPFGQKGSETYQNKTGVSIDSIHSDPVRRARYRARHKGEELSKWSSGWFAWTYLW